MDETKTPHTQSALPRLSAEALALISRHEFTSITVDLRPFVALTRDVGPAVMRAAIRWGVQPDDVVV